MSLLQFIKIFGVEEASHAAEAAGHATEESEGIAALGIDPIAILAQAGTFLILFLVLRKFALGKIVATLEKRRQTIDDGVRLGLEMEAERERLNEEIEKALHKARLEADKIIAAGHEDAGAIVKGAEELATRKTDAMLRDSHARIGQDIDNARMGLEREMRELVADATEVILGEKLDAQKDDRLIEQALHGVRTK